MAYPELLSECVAKRWDVTDCFFGGSFGTEFEERTRLDRAYVQASAEFEAAAHGNATNSHARTNVNIHTRTHTCTRVLSIA
eukprot:6212981-Pleurochrysis_carterae.AAC.5